MCIRVWPDSDMSLRRENVEKSTHVPSPFFLFAAQRRDSLLPHVDVQKIAATVTEEWESMSTRVSERYARELEFLRAGAEGG